MSTEYQEFLTFLNHDNLLNTTIAFVIASQAKKIISKFTNEVIIPLTEGKHTTPKEIFKKINVKTYFFLIIQLIIIAYVLFLLSRGIKKVTTKGFFR